jgi:hypothetical protein
VFGWLLGEFTASAEIWKALVASLRFISRPLLCPLSSVSGVPFTVPSGHPRKLSADHHHQDSPATEPVPARKIVGHKHPIPSGIDYDSRASNFDNQYE